MARLPRFIHAGVIEAQVQAEVAVPMAKLVVPCHAFPSIELDMQHMLTWQLPTQKMPNICSLPCFRLILGQASAVKRSRLSPPRFLPRLRRSRRLVHVLGSILQVSQ
jgi:hypothetical protein